MPYNDIPFEDIAESYQPLIKKMVRQYNAGMTYDEAYQMGLIALWEACLSFDPDRGYFPAYAKVYLTGTFLTYIRHQKRDRERLVWNDEMIAVAPADMPDYDNVLIEAEVKRHRQSLSPREYSWLYLTVMKDLAPTDIAKALNVSPHTVRSWKKTAIKKLRQVYGH